MSLIPSPKITEVPPLNLNSNSPKLKNNKTLLNQRCQSEYPNKKSTKLLSIMKMITNVEKKLNDKLIVPIEQKIHRITQNRNSFKNCPPITPNPPINSFATFNNENQWKGPDRNSSLHHLFDVEHSLDRRIKEKHLRKNSIEIRDRKKSDILKNILMKGQSQLKLIDPPSLSPRITPALKANQYENIKAKSRRIIKANSPYTEKKPYGHKDYSDVNTSYSSKLPNSKSNVQLPQNGPFLLNPRLNETMDESESTHKKNHPENMSPNLESATFGVKPFNISGIEMSEKDLEMVSELIVKKYHLKRNKSRVTKNAQDKINKVQFLEQCKWLKIRKGMSPRLETKKSEIEVFLEHLFQCWNMDKPDGEKNCIFTNDLISAFLSLGLAPNQNFVVKILSAAFRKGQKEIIKGFSISLDDFKSIYLQGYKIDTILKILNTEVRRILNKQKEREEYKKIKFGEEQFLSNDLDPKNTLNVPFEQRKSRFRKFSIRQSGTPLTKKDSPAPLKSKFSPINDTEPDLLRKQSSIKSGVYKGQSFLSPRLPTEASIDEPYFLNNNPRKAIVGSSSGQTPDTQKIKSENKIGYHRQSSNDLRIAVLGHRRSRSSSILSNRSIGSLSIRQTSSRRPSIVPDVIGENEICYSNPAELNRTDFEYLEYMNRFYEENNEIKNTHKILTKKFILKDIISDIQKYKFVFENSKYDDSKERLNHNKRVTSALNELKKKYNIKGFQYFEKVRKKYSHNLELLNANPDIIVLKLVNYLYKKNNTEMKKPFKFPNEKLTHQYVLFIILKCNQNLISSWWKKMDPYNNGYISITQFGKILKEKGIAKDQHEVEEMLKAICKQWANSKLIIFFQFVCIFAKSMFKGALMNIYSFLTNNVTYNMQSLPFYLKILYYQRKLYLSGIREKEMEEKDGRNGREVLMALHKYKGIKGDNITDNYIRKMVFESINEAQRSKLEMAQLSNNSPDFDSVSPIHKSALPFSHHRDLSHALEQSLASSSSDDETANFSFAGTAKFQKNLPGNKKASQEKSRLGKSAIQKKINRTACEISRSPPKNNIKVGGKNGATFLPLIKIITKAPNSFTPGMDTPQLGKYKSTESILPTPSPPRKTIKKKQTLHLDFSKHFRVNSSLVE